MGARSTLDANSQTMHDASSYRINADGTGERRLTSGAFRDADPSVEPHSWADER